MSVTILSDHVELENFPTIEFIHTGSFTFYYVCIDSNSVGDPAGPKIT